MQHQHQAQPQHQDINEGLEKSDLVRLVHPELHIDEFKSKLGRDSDVCVFSFKIHGREPAQDLVNFLEKGYDWIIDADASSGEMDDGDYIVFAEADRDMNISKNIMKVLEDLMNLTDQDVSEWRVRYHHDPTEHDLDEETLSKLIPSSPEEYRSKVGSKDLDEMRTAAGIPVHTKAPKNDYTQGLRTLAGII